jgi:hypothetical protein
MATKRSKAQPASWKGDEVGHAAERSRTDEAVDVPEAAADALSPEEKMAEVAEEHQARQASEGRGHGKL